MHRLPRLISNPSGCPRHGVGSAGKQMHVFCSGCARPSLLNPGMGTRHLPASSPSGSGCRRRPRFSASRRGYAVLGVTDHWSFLKYSLSVPSLENALRDSARGYWPQSRSKDARDLSTTIGSDSSGASTRTDLIIWNRLIQIMSNMNPPLEQCVYDRVIFSPSKSPASNKTDPGSVIIISPDH